MPKKMEKLCRIHLFLCRKESEEIQKVIVFDVLRHFLLYF